MNRNQRIALAERGLTVKGLGVELDLHPGYVSNVLAGRYEVPRTREKIAKALAKTTAYLWPSPETED